MDEKEQAAGERRVRELLVVPLQELGLARPSTLTVNAYEEMLSALCCKLAYMSEINLRALQEVASGRPGGAKGDRFPIAANVLKWASDIQAPDDDGSPLVRAVFAHRIGIQALDEGWAPELLGFLKSQRSWPKEYDLRKIRDRAQDIRREFEKMNDTLRRGGTVSNEELARKQRRAGLVEKCRRIAALVQEGAA